MQQGDVLLFQTDDNGDIDVTNGVVQMSGGLETSAYLSLFGGNEDDDGSQDSALGWWGNLEENEKSFQYVSETQFLLNSLPATTSNLRRVESAAKRDLAWFVTEGVASSVTVEVTIPALNRLKLTINIDQNKLEFIENWRFHS